MRLCPFYCPVIPPKTGPTADATEDGLKWAYLSDMAVEECPNRFPMTWRDMPAIASTDAAWCLQS